MPLVNFQMRYNGAAAAYGSNLHTKLSAAVKKIARDVQAQAVQEIKIGESIASGHIYRRGNVEHQASSPNDPPSNDTGNLAASISVTDDSDLKSTINVGAEYGLYLEVGTARMSPRPFLSPALAFVEPAFRTAIQEAMQNS